jgi:amidase
VKITTEQVPVRDAAGLVADGPIARSVRDAARSVDVILRGASACEVALECDHPVIRAAWSENLGYAETDPAIAAAGRAAARRLAHAGVLALRELPVRFRDPEPAWRELRAPRGNHLAVQVLRAENDRRLENLFEIVDLLVCPTTPGPPHGHAGPGARINTSLTWAFNLSGHPAATVPVGFTGDGCPIGLQPIARHHHEAVLFTAAVALERIAPWPSPELDKGDAL